MKEVSLSYNAKGACIGDKLCKVYITGKQQIYLFIHTSYATTRMNYVVLHENTPPTVPLLYELICNELLEIVRT